MKLEDLAKICHQANKYYCESIGDWTQVAWGEAPEWQKDSAMTGVSLHYDHPEIGAEAGHESWMKEKIAEGWTFGKVKSFADKTHPCILPFDQLPPQQQAKDHLFKAIVNAVTPFFPDLK